MVLTLFQIKLLIWTLLTMGEGHGAPDPRPLPLIHRDTRALSPLSSLAHLTVIAAPGSSHSFVQKLHVTIKCQTLPSSSHSNNE